MNSRPCILGTGSSGLAAARLLRRQDLGGGCVCAEKVPPPAVREAFADAGFSFQQGLPDGIPSQVVVSPGFALDHLWLEALRAREIPLIPEFALGAAGLSGRVVAITGSLGKTTMAMLAAELLRAEGKSVTLSGNIGVPVSEVALTQPAADVHVIELSSFQTELNEDFRPDIGILLNLFPNHLDRHHSMEAYAKAKARMFRAQTAGDLAVISETFSGPVPGSGRKRVPDVRCLPDLTGTAFDTPPLRANLAALLTGLADFQLSESLILQVLNRFEFPPHRMQEVGGPGTGRIIDDSKSTCLSATLAALKSVPGPVRLIAGGVPKGESLEPLKACLREKTVHLHLFGSAGPEMADAWGDFAATCGVFLDLSACMDDVFQQRSCTETLLFSPGCASFDQYSGYAERGKHFQSLIRQHTSKYVKALKPEKEIV
ncbi:MAG: hypothetical protein JJU29_09465 [Verrucomicrobia bacterium]|nr:hypothetical protein [Verrucomicrobiota bacterium]MCH8510879.1 hypothetical protein [Kiritimatiellia bacterium]